MRISDWSSDVCSSDLAVRGEALRVWQPVRVGDWPVRTWMEAADCPPAEALARARRLHIDGEAWARSEEHTSELQSLMRISYAVFCLKNKKKRIHPRNAETYGQSADKPHMQYNK